MKIIVQKFGGTSVATAEQREQVVRHIRSAAGQGYMVAVVVSAMGRAGDPYATDTLIRLIKHTNDRPSRRELDMAMSCGEIISASLMAQILTQAGIPATALTGAQAGIVTDDNFGNARIVEIKPEPILEVLQSGHVAVIAGFQGITRDGEITTLGRGGSDTTAVALGAALRAEVVEVFTDVDGVMTADPRIVTEARTLQTVTYREVAEMAHMGARVIHPRAVEIAMEEQIPIKVRCTFSDAEGTLIGLHHAGGVEIRGDRVVTGIAYMAGLGYLVLRDGKEFHHSRKTLAVFRLLADAGISLDLIHVAEDSLSFAVGEEQLDRTVAALSELDLSVQARRGFAKVSAVGAGMRGVPGVMATIMEALARAKVPVYHTTDSHSNIACLVERADLERAVRALHRAFDLDASNAGGNAIGGTGNGEIR